MASDPRSSDPEGFDVVVLGGANIDILVRAERLPRAGETVQGDVLDEAPGGKGANQAVAAARLGARVAFVGRVGGDLRGTRIRDRLMQEGVDTRSLQRDLRTDTGVALVVVDRAGEKQIAAAAGASGRLSTADVRSAGELIRHARVLVLPLDLPLAVVEAAVGFARAGGAIILLDAAPARPLPARLLRRLDIVHGNAAEIATLTGLAVDDFPSAQRAARALRESGVGTAIVGAGEDGDLILSPEGEQRLVRLVVESVDTTGAGDAFVAAVAVAVSEKQPWSEAGRFASGAAALKTTRLGAQQGLPRRARLLRFLQDRRRPS